MALVALGDGKYRLDGTDRMRQRPMGDLLEALSHLGVSVQSESNNGCPPIIIESKANLSGGTVRVGADSSSQFVTALLMAAPHRLLACKGCGSVVVEAAFALAGVPLEVEEVDYSASSPTRARLLELNALGQVPVLVLPDKSVLTESLAMLHYLNDLEPSVDLIPPPGDATRKAFYRWSLFFMAALYPTWTYGDEPAKWVKEDAAAKQLRESTDEHRKTLWRMVEPEARAPWFLGERMSAIDLYLAAMTRWRPGVLWFAKRTPRLVAVAKRAAALDAVAPVMQRNFG